MILGLFFTRGVSLESWASSGLLCREKKIYEKLLSERILDKVYWFTYGDKDEALSKALKSSGQLNKDIIVIGIPKYLKFLRPFSLLYSIIIPFLHIKELRKCNLLKTNQMNGSWSALICKLLLRKPLVLRTGFTLSKALLVNSFLKRVLCRIIERLMYRFADYSVVTSLHDKIFIESIYKVKRIKIIPNLVDTENFKDLHLYRDTKSLLYIGRLSEDKNLFNLIEAVSNVRLKLVLYGSGPLKDQLISFAKHVSAEVQFKDPISNFLLPEVYNKYAFYILVSPKEGMPKTLIEAMACGCICIGTDVEGINEIIKNGKNGLLIRDTSVNSIEFVLKQIIKRQIDTFTSLKKNSLSLTKNLYSLETVAEMEAEVLRLVANGGS